MKIRLEARLPPGRWARAATVLMLALGALVAVGLPILIALYAWSSLIGP